MGLYPSEDFQAHSVPVDIDPQSPDALRQIIDLAKQTLIKLNEFNERIKIIEEKLDII